MHKHNKIIHYFTITIIILSFLSSLQPTQSFPTHHHLNNLLTHNLSNPNKIHQIQTFKNKFLQFTFNMNQQQLNTLVFDIVQLYYINPNSLFYLPIYFINACQLLQSQKIPNYAINSIVQQKLKFIHQITCVQQFQREKPKILSQNHTISLEWNKIDNAVQTLSFQKFPLVSGNKSNQLEDIIMHMVQKAQKHQGLFEDLISNSCKTNQAESFIFNYKIKQKQQSLQMKRIKEKLLRKYLEEQYKICFNSFFMMQNHMQQIKHFQEVVDRILLNKTDIEFVVKDILRAKCQFTKHQQIYQTALTIVSQIQKLKENGKHIKLVEFENRLHKPICDILLVIEIENMGYEVQLAMDTEKARSMINHKSYEFSRSLVFSPISMLFFEFDKMVLVDVEIENVDVDLDVEGEVEKGDVNVGAKKNDVNVGVIAENDKIEKDEVGVDKDQIVKDEIVNFEEHGKRKNDFEKKNLQLSYAKHSNRPHFSFILLK